MSEVRKPALTVKVMRGLQVLSREANGGEKAAVGQERADRKAALAWIDDMAAYRANKAADSED